MKSLKAAKIMLCITGVLMFILGVLTLMMPAAALTTIAIFLGVGFLIGGVFCLCSFFFEKDILLSPGWVLVEGILDVIVGILLLANIGATVMAIPFIVAFWMLFGGITRIAASVNLKRIGTDKWWMVLITGILGILVSLFILFMPLAGAGFVVALIGAYLMVYGILIFVETITTKIPELPGFGGK